MNFLKKWWSHWRPQHIEDDIFGALHPQGAGVFTGEAHFYPTDSPILLYINGLESGPTDAQRSFYIKVQQTFPLLRNKILPIMQQELSRPKVDFDTEFPIHAITIPNVLAPFFEWDLTFRMEHDPSHSCTVYFQVWEPMRIGID